MTKTVSETPKAVEVTAIKTSFGPWLLVAVFSVLLLFVAVWVLNSAIDQTGIASRMNKGLTATTQSAYSEGYYDAMMSIMAQTSTVKRFQRDASQYGHHLNKIIAHIDSMLILNGSVDTTFYEGIRPKPPTGLEAVLRPSGYTKEPLSYQRMPKESDWERCRYKLKSGYTPVQIGNQLRTEGRFTIEAK